MEEVASATSQDMGGGVQAEKGVSAAAMQAGIRGGAQSRASAAVWVSPLPLYPVGCARTCGGSAPGSAVRRVLLGRPVL